jgi:CcmD family protein
MMTSLLVAYLAVWAAAAGYVGWLAVRNTELARQLEDLEQRVEFLDNARDLSRAA